MSRRFSACSLALGLAASLAGAPAARSYDSARADAHAPIGVMGEHVHHAGGRMLSYRFVRTSMDGNRKETERLGPGAVLSPADENFPVTPTDMDMEMHVLSAMWAPSHQVTLMAMVPFVRLDMDHRTRTGGRFTTSSNGIGDVRLSGLVPIVRGEVHRVHLNAGVSLPTGTISAKDETPMGRERLPYPMQLGSGSVDLLPGVTWNAQWQRWSAGAQAFGTLRTHRNHRDYRLGHRFASTVWGARAWSPWLSTSLRLAWESWGNVEGADEELNPALVPTADPGRQGGQRLDLAAGVNFDVLRGPLRGNRFAVEITRPLYQWLDGPQLEVDWRLVAGWQYAF